jgi:hypothetical protein
MIWNSDLNDSILWSRKQVLIACCDPIVSAAPSDGAPPAKGSQNQCTQFGNLRNTAISERQVNRNREGNGCDKTTD